MDKEFNLYHPQYKLRFEVNPYDSWQLFLFLCEMSNDERWRNRIEKMTHIQRLWSLKEQWFIIVQKKKPKSFKETICK